MKHTSNNTNHGHNQMPLKWETTFIDEVTEKMDCGITRDNAHADIDELIDEGYYTKREVNSLRRGLVGVGFYVEIPEPPKQDVLVGGVNGFVFSNTNRHDYLFKMSGKYYTKA